MEDKQQEGATGGLPAIRKKFEDRSRKKDCRSWENVSKKLTTLETNDAKLAYFEEKYIDLYNEYRKNFVQLNAKEKTVNTQEKENEHLRSDLGKVILVRSRLESLCRELQKQNKQIKEESLVRIKVEEDKRREISAQFADKLNDINNLMEESKEKGDRLTGENRAMTEKLTELYREFQKREHDIGIVSRELELEKQYHKEAIKKLELELSAQKHSILSEQIRLQASLEQSEANCTVLKNTVKGLQSTIDLYKTQYSDFESTMNKSDEVLSFFKNEMDRLNKQVKNFDEEAKNWRVKYQDSVNKIIDLSQSNQAQEQLIAVNDKKIDKLQKLCRQLQAERSAYLKLLKDNGIEAPNEVLPPALATTPTPATPQNLPKQENPKKTKTKLTKKEQQLQLLREEMKILQDELRRCSNNKQTEMDDRKGSAGAQNVSNIPQVYVDSSDDDNSNDGVPVNNNNVVEGEVVGIDPIEDWHVEARALGDLNPVVVLCPLPSIEEAIFGPMRRARQQFVDPNLVTPQFPIPNPQGLFEIPASGNREDETVEDIEQPARVADGDDVSVPPNVPPKKGDNTEGGARDPQEVVEVAAKGIPDDEEVDKNEKETAEEGGRDYAVPNAPQEEGDATEGGAQGKAPEAGQDHS